MSLKWYPVINDEMCTDCGMCIAKCTRGVYDKDCIHPTVILPENCVEGCRGCQKLCPSDAISYVGDDGAIPSFGCCS